jgi:uncharacterized protein YkwD
MKNLPKTATAIALLAVLLCVPAHAGRSKNQSALRARLAALQALTDARADALTLIRNQSRYVKGDKATQREVTSLTKSVEKAHAQVERVLMSDLKKLKRKKAARALNALQTAKVRYLNPWERALLQRLGDIDTLATNARLPKTLPKSNRPSTFQLEQLRLTNEYRMLMGLQALNLELHLVAAAGGHSNEMQRLDYFDHTSPNAERATPFKRASLAGFEGTAVGENIAVGYRSPRAVHRGWLTSPGHHRNIVAPDWEVMGVAHCSSYWTQVFGRVSPNS